MKKVQDRVKKMAGTFHSITPYRAFIFFPLFISLYSKGRGFFLEIKLLAVGHQFCFPKRENIFNLNRLRLFGMVARNLLGLAQRRRRSLDEMGIGYG